MKTFKELQGDLETQTLLHGPRHESVAAIHNDIGTLHFNNEDYGKALDCYELALDIAKDALGEDDEFVIDTHYRIGRVLDAKVASEEKLHESKMHLKETLKLRQKYDSERTLGNASGGASVNSGGDSLSVETKRKLSDDKMDSTLIYHDMAEQARLEGDLEKAQPLYIKSIELRRKKFGITSPALPPVLMNYAELLRQKGSYEAAKAVLSEALTINIATYGKAHRSSAEAMNNLGLVLRLLGELDRAEQALTEALKIRRGLFGDIDLNVGATLNNLAELYREKEQYQEAISYHNLAVQAFQSAGGEDHPGTINAKGNLGITLRRYAKVNADQGEELIRDTVQYLNNHEYQENHPWLLKFGSEHVISEAQKLALQGKHDLSLEMFDTLYRKKEQLALNGGESPPRAASPQRGASPHGKTTFLPASQEMKLIGTGKFSSMLGKAQGFIKKAKLVEATAVLQECADFPKELLGEDSVLVVETQRLQAEVAFHQADYEKAIELATAALQAKIDLFGPDSEKLVDLLILMAESYRALANYDEAEAFLNQALSLLNIVIKQDQQALGKAGLQHQQLYLAALQALGELHRNRGAYEVAAPLFEQAMSICRENLLEEDALMGEVYTSLGRMEHARGDLQKWQEFIACAMDNRTKNFGRSHPKVAATMLHQAQWHLVNCDFAQVGKLLQESRTVLTVFYGALSPWHPALCQCEYLQVRLHMALSEHDIAQALLQELLSQRIQAFGDRHPSVAQCLCTLADIQSEQLRLDEASRLYDSTLLIRREAVGENVHNEIIYAMYGTAMVAARQSRFAEAMQIFEECIEQKKTIVVALNGRYHTDLATMTMKYASIALTMGMTSDAATLVGQSGADQYSSFQSESHLRIADSLFHMAEISRAQGKYKDAKHQYSVCMSIRYRYLGRTHPDVLEVLYAACENMRAVGYFQDATDAVNALEGLVVERYGNDSLHEALVHKLKAHIYCDKATPLKAESLYQSALATVCAKLGDTNTHVVEIKAGQARCLLLHNQLAEADKLFREAYALSKQLLGANHHVTMEIMSNMTMTKLNRKPDVVQTALTTMKEQVLPFYSSVYGAVHPYTAHATGRVGMFMNCLKKESGRKHVQKALKLFDEYKQFPFTQDHPWVLELGGYVKRSSQERLSQAVEVQALASWCMPRFEGDVNYGTAPKHFWLDLSNNNADAWGAVHYYGNQKEPPSSVLPIIQQAREEREENATVSRAGTAEPAARRTKSPPRQTHSSKETDVASPEKETATLEGGDVVEDGDLASALAAEQRARQDAEDMLESELASRRNIEEQLEQEQQARKEMDEKLALEQEERRKLELLFQESMEKLKELSLSKEAAVQAEQEAVAAAAAAAEAAVETTEPIDSNEDSALDALVGEDQADGEDAGTDGEKSRRATGNTVESDRNEDVAAALAAQNSASPDTATAPPAATIDYAADAARRKADLEAAEFLFARAVELQGQGWYRKAHPLIQECLLVRERHLPEEDLTIATMTSLARSHMLLNEWTACEEVIQPCLKLAEKICKIESVPFAEALLVKSENLLLKGRISDAAKSLNKSTKLITKMLERIPTANALLGRSVCLQALANLRLGKIPEAKAMADRGAALLSKAYGINHIAVIDALHVKCEILVRTSKFKEAVAQVEQTYVVRRRLLGETHPAVADSLLFMGISLVGIGKFQEGQTKFHAAKEIRLEYFGENSLEYAEVLHFEALLCVKLCEFQEALRKNLDAVKIRQACLSEKHPTLSDSYHSLGVLYTLLAQFKEADRNLTLALAIRQGIPAIPGAVTASEKNPTPTPAGPAFHPLIAQTKCAQAELYRLQGDYELGRVLIEQSVEEYKTVYGKENADYLHAQQCFGLLLRDEGDLENADKLNKRTIKNRRQTLGGDHPDLGISLLHQIDVLIDRGLVDEAQVMLTEANGIVKMYFGDCAAHTAVVQTDIVKVMIQLAVFERRRAESEVPVAPVAAEEAEPPSPVLKRPVFVRDPEDDMDENSEVPEDATAGMSVEPPEEKIPVFPNEEYLTTAEMLENAVTQLQSMYLVSARRVKGTKSSKKPQFDTPDEAGKSTKTSAAAGSSVVPGVPTSSGTVTSAATSLSQHPLVIYLQGCLANTRLLEHLAKQRFAEALSVEDREKFNNHESFLRLQSKVVQLKPTGLPELENAVEALTKYPTSTGVLGEEHLWLKKLKAAVSNVVFVLSDMEVAANTFIEASNLHRKGKFAEADAKLDDVFITQLNSLGSQQASNSLVVAETLFAKAENCRFLGEIELSKMLYNQSISIFRQQQGGESEGVVKGIMGLTALLSWQGHYEDAYSVHNRLLPLYVKLFTEQSLQVALLKAETAFDQFKLAKFEKAVKLAKEALHTLTHLAQIGGSAAQREDQANVRILLANIYLAQGHFTGCKDQIDLAQALLDGESRADGHSTLGADKPLTPTGTISDDLLMPMSALLECKAEYLATYSKYFSAHKTITAALKMRVKALGRTNRIAEGGGKNADRKVAFFDALDQLSAETHKGDNASDEGSFLMNHTSNKQDQADKMLDVEMQEAFNSIMETAGFSVEDATAATVPSALRFGKRSHTQPVFQQRGVAVQSHPLLADTLLLKGRISLVLGDFTEAKEMLDGALGMLNELFPKPSMKKLAIQHELADLIFRRGSIEDARVQHTSVLQQRLQLCEEDHPDKADSLFKIAVLNNLLSKYDDSTQILTEAMNLGKKAYGEQHWKVAEVYAECALVLHAKGFFADSDSLYDKAMIIAKKSFGDLHLVISTIYMGQAANARESGLLDQASASMEQALSMRGMLIGEAHADTAYCMYQQAHVMRCLGKILDAKRLLDAAIAIQREKLSKTHPYTAMTLLSMAVNFMDLAKYSTAKHVFHRAIQLIKKSFGKDHVLIADGLTGLAENSKCQGLYEEAKTSHEQALYLRRKLLGERHHHIAESVYFLGEIHLIQAKFEDATKCFDDALALQRMALGQVHPSIATTMHGLGKVMTAMGRMSDAKSTHDRAYSIRKHCLAGDHPDIGDSQYLNALVYQKMGKYDQAAALFERCLNTVRDARGARHPMVAAIIYHSAEVANHMGRFHQAESLLLEALQIRLMVFKDINENHPDIAETYFGLAENLRLRGKFAFLEDTEKELPEVKKVFQKLPKVGEEANRGPTAPYDVSMMSENAGMSEVVDSILDGTSGKHPSGNTNHAQVGSTIQFDPINDEYTAPTVMISAIEKLDPPHPHDVGVVNSAVTFERSDSKDEIADDFSIPQQVIDHRALTDDPKLYKALPMYKRVLAHLEQVFPTDHPVLLQTQFAIAETTRLMGKYDLALENHQDILTLRRKLLGDNHPDTVLSMLAIGESLQGLGKIYPETASGSVDAKQVRMAKQAISLGVSLLDHLSSLVAPVITEGTPTPLPPAPGASLLGDAPSPGKTGAIRVSTAGKKKGDEKAWDFLSKPDLPKKKKEALKLPKGYMGYQFPAVKKIIRQEGNSATRPKKVRTGDAKWLYDCGITAQKRNYGENSEHPMTASLLFAKGELLRLRGDNSAALTHYDAALVMRRKMFRGNHPCIADCINSMAEVFRVENKFRQALPMYDKALEIRMEAYEGCHPSVAEVKNNLAMLAFAEGRYPEAQKLFEEALKLCEELLGASHPSTAGALTNLAGLLQAAGQHRLALPLYQRALAIKTHTYGEEHVEVASTLNNLGLLYKALGMFEESQTNYEKALEIQRKLHGTTHKDIATTLNNMAALYVSLGKRHDAKELYKDSVSMRSALFGVDHPTVAATLNNYAGLLFSMGEYEPAKDYFEDALRIRRKVLGENHPSVAETLNNIGLLLYTQGQLKDALPCYERALEIKRAAFGDMNPSVATSLNNLASVYHKVGHFDHAAALYKNAYDIRKSVLGEVHDDTLVVEENLKAVKRDKQKWLALQGSTAAESANGSTQGLSDQQSTSSSMARNNKGANKSKHAAR